MDKKEKYIEFIVNDIVKHTVIDGNEWTFPFMKVLAIDPIRILFKRKVSKSFVKYCVLRYGVLEDEVQEIWDQYLLIMTTFIDFSDGS